MTSPLRSFDIHTETAYRQHAQLTNFLLLYSTNNANAILTALELTGPNAELRSIRQTDQWD